MPQATYGLLARYGSPGELVAACEQVRDAGYRRWDAHTPFPVHGLDRAMGLAPSILPRIVAVMGFGGAAAAFTLQWWVHTRAYPLVISGKPLFSWQAFVPVTFEVGVLCGALGAVFGMLGLNKLPMHYHPLFHSSRFELASNDGFFLSVESSDPRFELEATASLLRQAGALEVERIEP